MIPDPSVYWLFIHNPTSSELYVPANSRKQAVDLLPNIVGMDMASEFREG